MMFFIKIIFSLVAQPDDAWPEQQRQSMMGQANTTHTHTSLYTKEVAMTV